MAKRNSKKEDKMEKNDSKERNRTVWRCIDCGHLVNSIDMPSTLHWSTGHSCTQFRLEDEMFLPVSEASIGPKEFEFYDFESEAWRPFGGHLIDSEPRWIPLTSGAVEELKLTGDAGRWFMCWLVHPGLYNGLPRRHWTLCREVG